VVEGYMVRGETMLIARGSRRGGLADVRMHLWARYHEPRTMNPNMRKNLNLLAKTPNPRQHALDPKPSLDPRHQTANVRTHLWMRDIPEMCWGLGSFRWARRR
jgi:hypothetical protein